MIRVAAGRGHTWFVALLVTLAVGTACSERVRSDSKKRLAIEAKDVYVRSGEHREVDRTDSMLETAAMDLKPYSPECPVVLSQDASRADYRLRLTFEITDERSEIGFWRTTVVRKNGDIMFTSSEYDTLADRSLAHAIAAVCKDAIGR